MAIARAGSVPAKRHEGRYASLPIICPPSMYLTATDSSKVYGIMTQPTTQVNYRDIPQWVRKQRYSWHGVDYPYHTHQDIEELVQTYCETLMGVDESIGAVMDYLKTEGLDKNISLGSAD